MRPAAVLGVAVFLGACAEPKIVQLDDIRDARGDTPGVPSEINCDPAPKHVFDKHGEIIDTVYPILHPSCQDDSKQSGGLAALFRPGPGLAMPTAPRALADNNDDDNNNDNTAAVDTPPVVNTRPQPGAAPTGPTTAPDPAPTPDPSPAPKTPEERVPKATPGQGS